MKKVLVLVLALVSLSATARSIKTSLSGELVDMHFDAHSELANLEVQSGNVKIDFRHETISLQFLLPWSCPINAFCATVMPERTIEVRNMTFSVDECQVATYVAMQDKRPADGLYEKITVRDYSRSTCPHMMIFPNVAVEYETKFYPRMTGLEVHHEHFFTVDELN